MTDPCTAKALTADKTKAKKRQDTPQEIVVSSGRVVKRPKRDFGETWQSVVSPRRTSARRIAAKAAEEANAAKKSVEAAKPPEKPPRKRGNERGNWATHDITMFYNALKEHGRDWKSLHSYIKRHRHQKGAFERSQEDVRQFYYRSWHKISKYIEAPEGLDKQVLELFSLVCYSSMRKKIGNHMDPKMGQKLNELVLKGSTQIRYKSGKKTFNVTLSVPSCATVKKIFNLQGIQFEKKINNAVRLPEFIKVELRPRTNAAWWTIQSMAQNPRLRTRMKPGQHLGQVMKHLSHKWKPNRLRAKEQVQTKAERCWQELRLTPPEGGTLHRWDFSRVYTSKVHHGLQKFQGVEEFLENLKSLNLGEKGLCARLNKSSRRITLKPPPVPVTNTAENTVTSKESTTTFSPTETPSDDPLFNFKLAASALLASADDPAEKKAMDKTENAITETKSDRVSTEDIALETACGLPDIPLGPPPRRPSTGTGSTRGTHRDVNMNSPVKDRAMLSPVSSATGTGDVTDEQSPSSKSHGSVSLSKQCSVEGDPLAGAPAIQVAEGITMSEKIEAVRSGLTAGNARHVTAAELYLMMDSPPEGRVVLEYEWVDVVPDPIPDILDMATLANCMRRLVHLGASEYATEYQSKKMASPPRPVEPPPMCCQCGGVQENGTPKGRARSKKGTPKQRKKTSASTTAQNEGDKNSITARPESLFSISSFVTEASSMFNPSSMSAAPMSTSSSIFQGTFVSTTGASTVLTTAPQTVFKIPTLQPPMPILNCPTTGLRHIVPKPNGGTNASQLNRLLMMPKRPRMRRSKPLLVQKPLLPKTTGEPTSQTYVLTPGGTLVPRTNTVLKQMHPVDAFEGVQVRSFGPEDLIQGMSQAAGSKVISQETQAAEAPPASTAQLHSMPDLNVLVASMQQSGIKVVTDHSTLSSCTPSTSAFPVSALDDQSSLSSMDNALQSLLNGTATSVSAGQPLSMSSPLPGSSISTAFGSVDQPLGPTPSMSALLDISLPSLPPDEGSENEKYLDLSLVSSGNAFNVSALLQSCTEPSSSVRPDQVIFSAGNFSPSKLLRVPSSIGGDDSSMPWLGAGEDFQLSNFIDDSPMKLAAPNMERSSLVSSLNMESLGTNTQSLFQIGDSSRDSLTSKFDIAAALNTVLAENSLDCFNRFESANLELTPAELPPQSQ